MITLKEIDIAFCIVGFSRTSLDSEVTCVMYERRYCGIIEIINIYINCFVVKAYKELPHPCGLSLKPLTNYPIQENWIKPITYAMQYLKEK